MLFRGRGAEPSAAVRFGGDDDAFAFRREGALYVAEVRASRERAADLYGVLIEQMPPVVDFSVECLRSGRRFVGEGLERAEVRDAVARMTVPLVASAGVELSVYRDDEQLSLSAMLDVWVYARTDRWLYLLQGNGVTERADLPARGWTIRREEFRGAPEMVGAVSAAAQRLTLHEVDA